MLTPKCVRVKWLPINLAIWTEHKSRRLFLMQFAFCDLNKEEEAFFGHAYITTKACKRSVREPVAPETHPDVNDQKL